MPHHRLTPSLRTLPKLRWHHACDGLACVRRHARRHLRREHGALGTRAQSGSDDSDALVNRTFNCIVCSRPSIDVGSKGLGTARDRGRHGKGHVDDRLRRARREDRRGRKDVAVTKHEALEADEEEDDQKHRGRVTSDLRHVSPRAVRWGGHTKGGRKESHPTCTKERRDAPASSKLPPERPHLRLAPTPRLPHPGHATVQTSTSGSVPESTPRSTNGAYSVVQLVYGPPPELYDMAGINRISTPTATSVPSWMNRT